MSERFNFTETPMARLFKIERKSIADSRGFFSRFFCAEEFKEIGFTKSIVQMNHTLTKQKGAVRGMHYQRPPYAEAKVITCVRGKIFDVVIDIRHNSKTYLKWYAEILSAKNEISLYIPEGFAHGFQALTDNCELIYLHTATYEPSAEGVINVLDSKVAIDWPGKITEISDRDNNAPMIDNKFESVIVA